MVQSAAALQRLRGVGKVLAKRLQEAGLTSFSSIAQAGEVGLGKVPGINPRAAGSIQEQANELSRDEQPGDEAGDQAVKERLSGVREKIQSVARATRNRFRDRLTGKCGKKLTSDLVRIEDALAKMSKGGPKRSKRIGKALSKVERRLTGLEDSGLMKVGKGLKKVRKWLLKAVR